MDTHCVAPQPGQGTQICQGDYQLCICRLQSLNKAMLTRTVQTSALILLLQTQGFSSQHPGFCSCARALSKYPHPIPDVAESTSLGLTPDLQTQSEANHSQLLSQSNPSPSCVRNVAHQRGHLQETTLLTWSCPSVQTGLLYTRQYSHFASLVCTGSRTESFRGYCSCKTSINHFPPAPYRPNAVTQRCDMTVAQQCHTLQHGHSYQWFGPLLLPEEKLGSFKKRTSPP